VLEGAQPWHLGSRVERVRASHSYGIVLAFIAATFVFMATAPSSDWADAVLVLLQTTTLVATLWTAGVARTDSTPSLALIALAALAALGVVVFGGTVFAATAGILSGALTLATIAGIALGVADQREANAQAVLGAICVYVLLGVMFTYFYGVAARLGSGHFFAQGTDGTRPIRLYFSFVTLATLGYGDYTPTGNLGRMLAVFEAVLGQLYLVTVIAVIVSRMRPRAREPRND
jgi:Ion channel